jgi:predicted ATPase/class 3 adenylate cyclase
VCVRRAAECALDVQARLHDYAVAADVRLSLKLAVGAGSVVVGTLGGVFDRWEFFVTGPPLAQVGVANGHAQPGQSVCSPEAWTLAGPHFEGEALDGGYVRIDRARDRLPAGPPPEPVALRPEAAPALRAFIPAAIRSRLDAGQSDWLAELRTVTVLFVNLPDLTHRSALDQSHSAMRMLQTTLYRFEGSINKLSVDDKGASLVAVMGLPPLAHEDDPARGARASVAMHEALEAMGLRCSIGVTTGIAFCGSVGAPHRREYTVMGDVVNLAARLMQAAGDGILCDRATALAGTGRLVFTPLDPIALKGKKEPVAVFRPQAGDASAEGAGRREGKTVGREAEREILDRALAALARKREGGIVVVEGEAGIGKSRLVGDMLARAREAGARTLAGAGDSIESATPYFAWRRVFAELFDLDAMPEDPAARRDLVLAALPDDERAREAAPLLGAVLPMEWPEAAAAAERAGAATAGALHDLLARLLERAAAREPLVLVVEDAHLLDTGSLALLDVIAERVRSLLLVVVVRPMGPAAPPELARLAERPGAEVLRLGPLAPEATAEIARSRLDVDELPAPVAAILCARAEGNPFIAEELAYAMRDMGLIIVEEGRCRIASGAGQTRSWRFPDTVQGIITSRIDRLPAAEQLTLKVASVIGRTFALRTVAEVYPIPEDPERLAEHLAAFVETGLVSLERPAPDLEYAFKHAITQEVAYDLLAYEQRRQLHRAVAEWVERERASDLEPFYSYLAHHWRRAAEDRTVDEACLSKAVDYLRRAGDVAARAHVNHEAIGFYGEVLRLLARLPESPARDRTELEVQLARGPLLIATRGYASDEVQRAYGRAAKLCASLRDRELLFAAMRGLWAFHIGRAEYRVARGLGERMLALAERAGGASERMEAHRALGNTLFWFGDLAAACDHMQQGIELYAPDRDRRLAFLYGQDPDVANRGMQTWPLALMGYPGAALARGGEALARAREVGHPYSLGYALVHVTCSLQMLGLVAEARERAKEAISLTTEKNFPNWLLAGMVLRGWALSKIGRAEEGVAAVGEAVDVWRSFGSELCVPYFLSLKADACVEAGRLDEALDVIREALDVAARNDDHWFEAEMHRLSAEIGARRGDPVEEVAARFGHALAVARRQGAALLELRAAVSLARLKPSDETRGLVAGVYGRFAEGHHLPDLVAARAIVEG